MRSLPVLLIFLALTACAGSPPPPDVFFRLETAVVKPLPAPIFAGVLEVQRLGAEGLVAERALLFSEGDQPQQLARYSYHFWTEPPASLLRDQMVTTLRAAGVAKQVVTADLRVPADYVIEGRLRRFEQRTGAAAGVVVDAEIGLIQVRGNRLLMVHDYHLESPAAGNSPEAAVAAFQTALDQLQQRFLGDLAGLAQP
ncbi:MAG TPA: ABC transporter [Rhodospirillaceae bacterium]|nr:ABC transporter [Rhodospirillaceae bacterium]